LILVYKLDFKHFSRNSKIFLKKCRINPKAIKKQPKG